MSAPKPTAPKCIAEALEPYLPVIHDESTQLGAAQAVWEALLAEGDYGEGPCDIGPGFGVLVVPLERDAQDA